MLREFDFVSEFDGLMLSCAIYEAEDVKGVIQFSYGMVDRCVFRHDGIVGAGFPGGARRDDTQLPVSAQLKGTAAVHTSLRLRQIDHRAGVCHLWILEC